MNPARVRRDRLQRLQCRMIAMLVQQQCLVLVALEVAQGIVALVEGLAGVGHKGEGGRLSGPTGPVQADAGEAAIVGLVLLHRPAGLGLLRLLLLLGRGAK